MNRKLSVFLLLASGATSAATSWSAEAACEKAATRAVECGDPK